jgi:hypothetical protein
VETQLMVSKTFNQLTKRDRESFPPLLLECQKHVGNKEKENGVKMPLAGLFVYQKCFWKKYARINPRNSSTSD